MKPLVFEMRVGDYECHACPKRLVRLDENDQDETVDFVRYTKSADGHEYFYSIGFFRFNDREEIWELRFVGDRFLEIPDEDIRTVWRMLKAAYLCLEEWSREDCDE